MQLVNAGIQHVEQLILLDCSAPRFRQWCCRGCINGAQIESFLIVGLFSTPRSNLFKWSDGHRAETDLVLQQEDWESKTTLPLLDSILFHRFPPESCVYVCESSNHLHFVTWQENTLRLDLSRGFSYLLSVFVESSRKLPQSSPAGPCWSGSPRRRWTHCSHLAFSSLSTSAKKTKNKNWHPTIKPGAALLLVAPAFWVQEGLRETSCYYGHVSGCGAWIAFCEAKIRGMETRAIRVFIKSHCFFFF